MNLHDAILNSLELSKTREFVLSFSNIPGRGEGSTLRIRVRHPQIVVICGTIEEDWFLSSVLFTTPLGATIDIAQTHEARLGRIIVQGTNGAFIEVAGGDLLVEFL